MVVEACRRAFRERPYWVRLGSRVWVWNITMPPTRVDWPERIPSFDPTP